MKGCAELESGARVPSAEMLAWLSMGYNVRPADGPALCTTGGGRKATPMPMPWAPTSLASELKKEMTLAYEELIADATARGAAANELTAMDVDLTLEGTPRWSSHSGRRGGTKRARELMHASGLTDKAINRHFRWHNKELNLDRSVCYAGMLTAEERMLPTRDF